MRNRPFGLLGAVALALAMANNGCSSSNVQGGTGGNTGSGGSAATGGVTGTGGSSIGTGGVPSCPNVTACDGSVIATWNVTSSCLALSGDMDVSFASLGCQTVPVTGALHVTGTWTANSNGTYTDNTVTSGSVTFPLAAACLSVSSVNVPCDKAAGAITALGWTTSTCTNDASGHCNCTATANQSGGIGLVSPWAMTSGNYTTSGSDLNTDATVDYSYCVAGSTLTVTPKSTLMPISGTVVLQKSGTSSGSGGASATGGATGSGGTSSTGGTVGTGGTPGTGGATGSGGKGGAGGTAGSPGTGGSAGKGGSGGTGATGGSTGASGASGMAPCDIYAAANTACVAAHSTVRALLGSFSGSLYQVTRASDGTTKDIGVVSPGGLADTATQDAFCSGTTCTITIVYDQSGHGNFVEAETPD